MLAKKNDVNGNEFEYCDLHSSDATSSLEAFSRCELEDNPECHPDREACPFFVEYMVKLTRNTDMREYSEMIFPARLKNGALVYAASPDHPDQTGLVDQRVYVQRYKNNVAVGPVEPMFDNQNSDGSYRFECDYCHRECNRCSWNKHCVCSVRPNCNRYTPEELAEIARDDDEDWDEDWDDE